MSLERWVCCPKGPRVPHPNTGQLCCSFCGVLQPDDAHTESHNFTACQERQLDERTFYRKDHLRQHLKLVHSTKYLNWSMDTWKVATPDIKSRCGFCGLALGSWGVRVDHLAEHFKTGSDMKDWKGDWGFENSVLSNVENAMPPCMCIFCTECCRQCKADIRFRVHPSREAKPSSVPGQPAVTGVTTQRV